MDIKYQIDVITDTIKRWCTSRTEYQHTMMQVGIVVQKYDELQSQLDEVFAFDGVGLSEGDLVRLLNHTPCEREVNWSPIGRSLHRRYKGNAIGLSLWVNWCSLLVPAADCEAAWFAFGVPETEVPPNGLKLSDE